MHFWNESKLALGSNQPDWNWLLVQTYQAETDFWFKPAKLKLALGSNLPDWNWLLVQTYQAETVIVQACQIKTGSWYKPTRGGFHKPIYTLRQAFTLYAKLLHLKKCV